MRPNRLLIIACLLLPACAAMDDSKKIITFDNAMWQYETAIRWVDFSTANSLRRIEEHTAKSPDPQLLQHIKVTSYTVVNKTVSADHARIELVVEIIYYHDERMKLTTLTDRQTWKYDPVNKSWYITTPLPAFK